VEPHEVAVLAGDAVALGDLGRLPGELGDPLELAGGGADLDNRRDGEAEGARVDVRAVAGDDPGPLEPLHALRRSAIQSWQLGQHHVGMARTVTEAPSRAGVAAAVGGRLAGAPPQAFFVVSAIFHYLGPSFAVLLFARVDPLGVAWLRVASAGALFTLWRRPWRALRGCGADVWRLVVALGVVLRS
jgi:hypothetical protein